MADSTSVSSAPSSALTSPKSSKITASPSARSQIPSGSAASPSSSSQITSSASTAAHSTPISHRPAVIAAIAISLAAVLVLVFALFLIYRRSARRTQFDTTASPAQSFLREPSQEEDKGWKESARTVSSSWPDEQQPTWTVPIPSRIETRDRNSSFGGKAPHYTVRSRASVSDVYGFGQDVAWQEAHYEDPLPPRVAIGVVPPTPPSANIHHSHSTPLLRNHSTASSISSEYSTASMTTIRPDRRTATGAVDGDAAVAYAAITHERALDMVGADDRDWLTSTQDAAGAGARRLV